jgi:hypothetical protein
MVLSRVYQLSSEGPEALTKADPENQLFGRANRKRLEGEPIRDALLVIGGKLDRTRGGMTFPLTLASDYTYKSPSLRRSVYLPHFRNSIPELLEVFDVADPSMVTGKRNTSTVAPQALFLMNHPFVAEVASAAAEHLIKANPENEQRAERAYLATLGRAPTSREREIVLAAVAQAKSPAEGWAAVFHALFASAEFRYVK